MAGSVGKTSQGFSFPVTGDGLCDHRVMVCDDDMCNSESFSDHESNASSIISTSSDFTDDATSSTSSSSQQDGPLFELSELMAQLPIKRGLSRHYQGKSQSFTSLSNVRALEDLAKKVIPYCKRMKSCKSYGGLLDCHKSYSPRASSRIISKRSSRRSFPCLLSKKTSFVSNRPPTPLQRTL